MRELYEKAADEFERRVERIGDDDWGRPTPCTDWDVRALVNHLVYENLWVPELMAGKTVADVGDRYEGDQLGDDPKGAWRSSLADAMAAVGEDGALERTVHLSFGDTPGSEYVSQLTTDLAIHAWDLAKAIGDDDTIDAELVRVTWDTYSPQEEMLRASGVFGAHVPVAADAAEQTKLLALLGRRRDWSA